MSSKRNISPPDFGPWPSELPQPARINKHLLQQKAEQGDADAQYELGSSYNHLVEEKIDYTEMLKWYRLAAKQGHASAQFSLGVAYHFGKGVPQDNEEAVKWYQLAATQGHEGAWINLDSLVDGGAKSVCPGVEHRIDELLHRWQHQFGYIEVNEAHHLKELERKNRELKEMSAESLLKNGVPEAVREKI